MNDKLELHGVLVVDKPQGPTSHDIVAQARRVLSTRSVGHTGTLDPMATGVLVLLVGEATKLSHRLSCDDKVYHARVRFGYATNTDDAFGEPIQFGVLNNQTLSVHSLQQALEVERHRKLQVPPAFSAIKQAGQPMHRRARMGCVVQVESRSIEVFDLQLAEVGQDYADVKLHVSKGYYVRALARDLGRALGCPAHLSELRRTRVGHFDLEDATPWPLPKTPRLTSVTQAVALVMPTYELTSDGFRRVRVGQRLTTDDFEQDVTQTPMNTEMAWLFKQQLIAIGRWRDEQLLEVRRGFNLPERDMPR